MNADVSTAADLAALHNQRQDALDVAESLEILAASLRAVAFGEATALEASEVRGNIDAAGELVVRACLDWSLLLRHGRFPTGLTALRAAEAARVLGEQGEAGA